MNVKNLTQEQRARAKAFKVALDALLKEHGCSLRGSYDGDSHGVYNEQFELTFYATKPTKPSGFSVVLNAEGMYYPPK